jgi:hypothetical protein
MGFERERGGERRHTVNMMCVEFRLPQMTSPWPGDEMECAENPKRKKMATMSGRRGREGNFSLAAGCR